MGALSSLEEETPVACAYFCRFANHFRCQWWASKSGKGAEPSRRPLTDSQTIRPPYSTLTVRAPAH
jgi:hypothetical protein